jgi:hypothetical protein
MRHLVLEDLINRDTPAASMHYGIRDNLGSSDLFLVLVNVRKEEKLALAEMRANITLNTLFIF